MPLTGSLVHQSDVVLHVAKHRLVDAVAFVRGASERQLDDGIDRKKRNLGLIGRAPDLIVGDDALGRQDHLVGGDRQIDVHELQPVDLRVAVGVAALDVDQGDVRIERRDQQDLFAGKRAIDLDRLGALLCVHPSPASIGSA